MKNYINGFIWGLKISIKIMARCKDINKSIMIICNIQGIVKKDQKKLYNNIQKLYTFDDDTIILPEHNYKGLTRTSIKEEKKYNTFITETTTEEEFIEKMNNRELPLPKYIDIAVPSNMISGEKVIKS